MKPNRIFLVRHGESLGNTDKSVYSHTPDWRIPLTEKGKEQAERAAEKIFKKIESELGSPCVLNKLLRDDLAIYCSPWYRTRMTAQPLRDRLKIYNIRYYEDPRLREQEWGNYQDEKKLREIAREREKFGTFFYRLPDGESGADVFDRIASFQSTLYRDFSTPRFPKNCVVFTHGLTLRIFLMRWFHYTVEEYEQFRNPRNCEIFEMEYMEHEDRYRLVSKLRKN